MAWKSTLKEKNAKKKGNTLPDDTEEQFIAIRDRILSDERKMDPTLLVIPQFYKGPKTTQSSLLSKLARSRMFDRHASLTITQEDLQIIYDLLQESVRDSNDEEESINYEAFCSIRDNAPPKCTSLFSSSMFLRFQRDEKGE